MQDKVDRMKQLAVLFAVMALGGMPAAASSCGSMAKMSLPNGTITMAQTVEAGAFPAPPGGFPGSAAVYKTLPAFCRVAATLTPSSDSNIKIEVWMPASTSWNGDLQSVGNGAWAGSISYSALGTAIAAGYAAASTDTGHTGNQATFAMGHPEKLIDFAYRAVHEMTAAAKLITAAYYGRGPARSYWNGCSTGGRQALVEAQRYPDDYDGIIAGAAANYVTHLQGAQVWDAVVVNKNQASYIPKEKYPAIHAAALAACDALDGVKDGVIDNPTSCHFDPAAIECKSADNATCLTAPQVQAARDIYAGPKTKDGKSLFPGLEPGSELGWATLSGRKPMDLAEDTYKYLVFQDPKWNYLSFDPARDIAFADRVAAGLMNSTDPDLSLLFSHGGKLLMYHGWADPGIAPMNSVHYYESVVQKMGHEQADQSIRLFMVPGMGHCRGGGTDTFDKMAALKEWVEKGKAPDSIPASRKLRDGTVDRTRPLCPYPEFAHYKGSGSTDDAANFACQAR